MTFRNQSFIFLLVVSLAVSLALCSCSHLNSLSRKSTMDSFALKDGGRVVFLGDSLTASRAYGEIIERYTLQSYPHRNIKFFNAGIGGDTAQGGLKRLDKTVLVHKPTVVTVCYGINDIGWGTKASPEHIQAYYDGMREITRRCQKAGARVYILGPCATKLGENDKESSDWEEKDLLAVMSRTVRKNAEEMGATPINLIGEFRDIEWKIRETGREKDLQTHAPDGIHLSELGNLVFAYILLKGMGAPDSVSDLAIDASAPAVKISRRCEVIDLAKTGDSIRFTRLDEGWPLHLGTFAWIHFGYLPSNEKLSRYSLKVAGLSASHDWYMIRVNGEDLSPVTRGDLEKGVNMAYMTPKGSFDSPAWKAQGATIEALTKARTQLSMALQSGATILPNDKSFSKKLAADTNGQIANMERLQHVAAEPQSLRFEIVPTEAPKPNGK